jgi:hypothetical protein
MGGEVKGEFRSATGFACPGRGLGGDQDSEQKNNDQDKQHGFGLFSDSTNRRLRPGQEG